MFDFEYDICFCERTDCPRKSCRRHNDNTPTGVPYSCSRLYSGEVFEECNFYLPGAKKNVSLSDSERVNINTATKEELLEVEGLGPVSVAGIIAYREKVGGFNSVRELLKCRGMGENKFAKIVGRLKI